MSRQNEPNEAGRCLGETNPTGTASCLGRTKPPGTDRCLRRTTTKPGEPTRCLGRTNPTVYWPMGPGSSRASARSAGTRACAVHSSAEAEDAATVRPNEAKGNRPVSWQNEANGSRPRLGQNEANEYRPVLGRTNPTLYSLRLGSRATHATDQVLRSSPVDRPIGDPSFARKRALGLGSALCAAHDRLRGAPLIRATVPERSNLERPRVCSASFRYATCCAAPGKRR